MLSASENPEAEKNVARFVLRINPVPSNGFSVFVADSVADKKTTCYA